MNHNYFSIFSYFLLVIILPVKADGLFYGESESMGDEASVSASKHEEELFKAPLSISMVSARQLQDAGVTTLAEAMKLVPGLIVREQTNGQYEVHIRGLESVINNYNLTGLANDKTLIMIDNRLVFDYFNGGLFWETLPLAVDDIERIEVVRGAVGALYGSNATNGVIHFITKRPESKQSASVNVIAGTENTRIANVSLEKEISGTSVRLSGLSEYRDRYESDYFSFKSREYENPQDIVFQTDQNEGVNSDQAKDMQSFMLTVNNDQTEYLTYDIGFFHQESEVQKIFLDLRDIPFSTSISHSDALNAKVTYGDLSTRLSYQVGKQETNGLSDFEYDVKVGQANIEYEYRLPQWIIRPGIHINNIIYDGPFIGGEGQFVEKNYLLRSEYFPNHEWRVIAALSYDDYNLPSEDHLSYQFMTTYQPRYDLLFRGGIQTANSSATMVSQYIDLSFMFLDVPNQPGQQIDVKGDEEGKLEKVRSIELGMRYQFDSNQLFDVELFHTELKDMTVQANKGTVLVDNTYITTLELEKLPLIARQSGMTVDWKLENAQWNLSTYLTWQKTDVIDQIADTSYPFVTGDQPSRSTPEVYGGVILDWKIARNMNLNVQSYYLGTHEFNLQQPQGRYDADGAMNSNITLNYRYSKNISGFAAIKNISASDHSQSFYSDHLDPIYMMGVRLSLSKD